MLQNIKMLVVILFLAAPILVLAKSSCLKFMKEEDFRRRRIVWIVLTIVAFLSPNFWIYAVVALPVTIWAGRQDSNPAALYVFLLYVIPAVEVEVPKLFPLDQARFLTLCVVIPGLLRSKEPSTRPGINGGQQEKNLLIDFLLFVFLMVMVVPYIEFESWTSVTRRVLSQMLDVFLPYLLFSRTLKSAASISDVMAAFVLSVALMVPVSVFEAMRGWLLYDDLARMWGVSANPFAYLMRAGQLRAQAATGHALALGFVSAIGFTYCLYLGKKLPSKLQSIGCGALMWAGLLAAYSRGPWVVALVCMFTYLWMMPRTGTRVIKALFAMGVLALPLLLTSYGKRLLDSLPFIGRIDAGNIEYRQRLLDVALELIPLNPWFGDLFVTRRMESMRQGQGIIDVVNGYLLIALQNGLVPLVILVCVLLLVLARIRATAVRYRNVDMDVMALGCSLVGCLVGAYLYIWIAGIRREHWMLLGLACAYISVFRAGKQISRVKV